MNARGFTLLETLLAGALVAVLLAGASGFYLMTVRYGNQDMALISLQRQATLVVDEMTRQIGPATKLEFGVTCGGDPNGLRATNPCGTFCFHRDTATLSQILEDRVLSTPPPGVLCPNQTAGTGTVDLLKDALIPASGAAGRLSTVDTACSATSGGFCPDLIIHNGASCVVGAVVTLRLRSKLQSSTGYQVMTFATSIAGRALPKPCP
jgi:type II secretory pathway pseudopilin PulG